MEITCCVMNCANSDKNGYHLFNFPKQMSTIRLWKEDMKWPGFKIDLKTSEICEAHFQTEDFKICLRESAVPSIYEAVDFENKIPLSSSHEIQNKKIIEKEEMIAKLHNEIEYLKTELRKASKLRSDILLNGVFGADQIQNLTVKSE